MPSSFFNWLHLTDLHWGLNGQGSLWPNVRQAFFEDLKKIHDHCGPWDALLFTGDLVQQGKREEYEQLEEKVLSPLRECLNAIGSGDAVLLAVPGNHDLARPEVKKPSAALKWLLKAEMFDEFADDLLDGNGGDYRQILSESFAEYSRWWDSIRKSSRIIISDGLLPGDLSATFQLDGNMRVGVVGLNTAFLQLAGGDYQGKLAWDLRQFHGACGGDGPGWVGEHDVCLLLTHHGPDWLNAHSSLQVYPEINPAGRFASHLFGHMHSSSSETRRRCGGGDLRQWQARSLFGLEKFGDPPQFDRRHGYVAGRIQFEGNQATIRQWPRIAVRDVNGWRLKPDDGAEGFVLQEDGGTTPETIKLIPRHRPSDSSTATVNVSSGLGFIERQSLDAYIKAARQLWDIIDLAGLPEDDRHLAMNKFLMRQLYAPLRLTPEIKADQTGGTDEFSSELEQRRDLKRLADAGRNVSVGDTFTKEQRLPIGQLLISQPPFKKHVSRKSKNLTIREKGNTPLRVPRLVVLGDPGGGKTTLLRWLATAYLLRHVGDEDSKLLPDAESLPERVWLPVLVRCRELDKTYVGQCTLEDILRQTLSKLELSAGQIEPLIELLRRMLEQGEVLLLIDGLDEITDPTLRGAFCGRIEAIAERFANAPIIITSRIVGYREMKRRLRGGFEHATLSDLSPEEKDAFINRWCEVTISEPSRRKTEEDKLIRSIHGSDRIERLTGNPMLLTTMALVQRKVGKLPSKRHKLYWEAVNVLLNWRSDVDDPLDADEALPQLEYVAWAMCDGGVQRLRRDQVLTLLEGARSDYPNIRPMQRQSPEDFLAQLERRTGLLVEMGYEQHHGRLVSVYEFRHLTFQEYLAALAIVEGRHPGHKRESTLAERVSPLAATVVESHGPFGNQEFLVSENWREVLRLCIASCNDNEVDAAILAILGDNNDIDGRAHAILAALCLADEPNVNQATAEIVLQRFTEHLKSPDGSGLFMTGLDRAAMELAASVWFDSLQVALVHEFQVREWKSRRFAGGLVGMISESSVPDDASAIAKWLVKQVSLLTSTDETTAIGAALALMNVAWSERVSMVPGLIDGLISLLGRSPAAANASSWALYWITGGWNERKVWEPTLSEFTHLLVYLNDTNTEPDTLRWLAYIAGKTRFPDAIPPLQKLLQHPEEITRLAALESIAQIHGSALDKKLLTVDFKGESHWIDPLSPINDSRIRSAANALKLPIQEIRQHYNRLAGAYGLQLNLKNTKAKRRKKS